MAAERRHCSSAQGVRVLILFHIIWQKRKKGKESWKNSPDLNSLPEGKPVAAFFGSPVVLICTAVLRCWSSYLSMLLSSFSRSLFLDLGNEGRLCPCYTPALTRVQREELWAFFWVSLWWRKSSDALWSEMQGFFQIWSLNLSPRSCHEPQPGVMLATSNQRHWVPWSGSSTLESQAAPCSGGVK